MRNIYIYIRHTHTELQMALHTIPVNNIQPRIIAELDK